ncbi:MAG: hypothetical protein ACXQTP_06785 [Candidatus Methanofastidiosia archaeon]
MKKILWSVFFIFLVLFSAGCIGNGNNTPEDTIIKYYDGLNERNPQKVLETLSKEVIENAGGEKAVLASLEETIKDLEENDLFFEIREISSTISESEAIVNLKISISPKESSEVSVIPYTFALVLEDQKWKIKDVG